MLSKRDLQLVRLACSRRFISAEQGEEVLALKKKLGAKLAIEEIFRRQGYLDKDGLAELIQAADQVVSRRARPNAPPKADRLAEPPRPVPVAPSRRPGPARGAAPSRRPGPPPREVTRFEPSPYARPDSTPSPDGDEPPEDNAERTVISMNPGLAAWAEAQAQARGPQAPKAPLLDTADDADRTALDMSIHDVRAAVEAYKKKRAQTQQGSAARPAPASAPPTPPGPIGVVGGERTLFDFRPNFQPKVETVPPVLEISLDDQVQEDQEEEQLHTILGMSPIDGLERPTDPFGVLPDSSLASLKDTPHESMPGESLASLMLGSVSSGSVLDAVTADGYRVGDVLADEGAAEALLGPFGRYELERVIARGARSVVFLATESEANRAVALKLLAGSAEDAAKLLAEHGEALLLAAALDSPHVVRVLDAGRVEGRYFVAMQYVDGWTLGDKLDADEQLSVFDAISMVRDVALGLADAAAIGLLHGRLDPDSIFLADRKALLGGIGLGSPLRAADPAGAQRDLAALGAILHRLLSGRPLAEDAPLDPKVPVLAAAALRRLLGQDPSYSATLLAQDLEEALAEVAPGPAPSRERAPLEVGPLAAKAILGAVSVIAFMILGPLLVQLLGIADWSGASAILRTALVGALALSAATVLFSVLSLIRRGELPLPMSSAWLVRLQEGAGTLGAAVLVTGFSLAPPALLNLAVAGLSVLVLGSGIFGWFLRRGVAAARSDRGVGRVLAVLGDPVLGRWRALHIPMTTALAGLASLRFALLAYFSAS